MSTVFFSKDMFITSIEGSRCGLHNGSNIVYMFKYRHRVLIVIRHLKRKI